MGIGELEVWPVVIRGLVIEKAAHRLHPFFEQVEPLFDRWEVVAKGAELRFVPAAAHAKLQPPAGEVVNGNHGLREQAEVAIGCCEHHAAETQVARLTSDGGEQGYRFVVRRGLVRGIVEMVPHREPAKTVRVRIRP